MSWKLSCPVLRGGESGDARTLPDEVASSQFFPGLDFQLLARYIQPQNQPQAIKDFLVAIRSN
jgi:hypothetical protein